MHIRKMTIDDYDKVYYLWMSCVGMGLNNLDDSREGIDKFILRNPDTCLVAENDFAIVGVILVGNDGRRGLQKMKNIIANGLKIIHFMQM